MATDDEKVKFSIYLPGGMVSEIDADAAALEISRTEWIRRSCDRTLHPPAPVDTPATDTHDTPADTHGETSTTALSDAIARADMLASDLDTMTAERDRAREDLDTLRTRADQAEAVAAERLARIAELRADLDAERERSRSDVIQAAALAVRAALPSSSTTAAETTRRTIRERVRDWLNR